MNQTEPAILQNAPPPVLFNTWKHHAGVLRCRIDSAIAAGPAGLTSLARNLVVLGTELMDLYLGGLSPCEIADLVLTELHRDNRLTLDAYRAWIDGNRGYQMVTLADDGSQWVLRLGDETDRWVHLHPARWAPLTCRVKANVLKTAIMALTYTGVYGGDPADLAVVNAVRRDFLTLAPLGRPLAGDQGIGQTIELMRTGA